MKTVYVLFCLALAGASANIFKKSKRIDKNFIMQPWDYISQYQEPLYRPPEQTYQEYIKNQKPMKHDSTQSSEESRESREIKGKFQKYVSFRAGSSPDWNPFYSSVMNVNSVPSYKSIAWSGQQVANPAADEKAIQKIFNDARIAMRHPTAEEKARFHEAFTVAAKANDEDATLNATELLKKYQYPVEEYTVKTDDGYFLTLFRIPARKLQARDYSTKPVVFLMHGLFGSADDWLLMGPGKSLAYLLSDAGYDVWLGNARGNKYSRRHVSKHPALSDFWQFSNDEVALFDLPAMIDFALQTSGQERLHYVGHAQGSTAFFALAAARPEYNDKITSMHAFSPMVYMTHVRSPLIRMIVPTSPFEERLHRQIGHGEFRPTKEMIATVGGDMCETEIGCKDVCSNVNFVMSGVNIDAENTQLLPVIVRHLPAGGSARAIKQYGQAVASGEFRKYDFGPGANREVYGTAEPPKYNMSKVTAPVTLYSAVEDWLAHPADVTRLETELPHSETYEVPDPHFAHMDFQFSTKAPELVYKKLIDAMNSY